MRRLKIDRKKNEGLKEVKLQKKGNDGKNCYERQ